MHKIRNLFPFLFSPKVFSRMPKSLNLHLSPLGSQVSLLQMCPGLTSFPLDFPTCIVQMSLDMNA